MKLTSNPNWFKESDDTDFIEDELDGLENEEDTLALSEAINDYKDLKVGHTYTFTSPIDYGYFDDWDSDKDFQNWLKKNGFVKGNEIIFPRGTKAKLLKVGGPGGWPLFDIKGEEIDIAFDSDDIGKYLVESSQKNEDYKVGQRVGDRLSKDYVTIYKIVKPEKEYAVEYPNGQRSILTKEELDSFNESSRKNEGELKYFTYTQNGLKTKADCDKALSNMKKALAEEPNFDAKKVIQRDMEIVKSWKSQKNESTESVQVMLDKSLSEENKAVADYLERAAKCKELGDIKAAELFEELARDESVHVAQLTEAKELFGYTDAEVEQEGSKEAQELLNKGEN